MDFSWYFDFRGIKHVTCNNDLLVSLKKFPYKNTIIIGRGKNHHVIGKGNMIAKFKIGEIKHISRIFYVLIFFKNMLSIRTIANSRLFFPNTFLLKA
jgi:hypothetical protein